MRKNILSFLVILVLGFALAGCSGQQSSEQAKKEGILSIVATTTIAADLAKNIGQEHVTVKALMGPGVDPHVYQASAGDVNQLQSADVVLYHGLHLEGKMGEIFGNLAKAGKKVIRLEDGLVKDSLIKGSDTQDVYDPHIWFDVNQWQNAAKEVANTLVEYDKKNEQSYKKNLAEYLTQLDELDKYVKARTEEIPQQQRVLVTAHDAFSYFARGYGYEVKALQGISTEAQAGTADVSNLAQFIADRQIKAIFIESSVSPKAIQTLQAAVKARGFDVKIGGELYSDSLGDEKSNTQSYILTFKANVDTIVNALK